MMGSGDLQGSLFDESPAPPQAPAEAAPAQTDTAAPPGSERVREPEREYTAEERLARMAVVREEALVCTRCALSETRTQVVFGEGNANTPLVLVGEGPGETEDATGRPFVGRAGKLLDEVLRENGMTRQHVYICNVLKCRAALLENGRLKNRPPRVEEAAACRNWLDTQLAIIRPLVIVCLGSPAANAVIHPNFVITRERGKWFTDSAQAPWVMAALHPAYILRQHGEAFDTARASLVSDIGAARLKVVEVRRLAKARTSGASPG
jgi:uracil-DNA glycosylase family protein